MALIPKASVTLSNDHLVMSVKDDTVYGSGNPTRAESLVNWEILHKKSDGDDDITPTYDETNDFNTNPLQVPITADGWYRIKITITESLSWAGAPFTETLEHDEFVRAFANDCTLEELVKIVKDNICGCENEKDIVDICLLMGEVDAAEYAACTTRDLLTAQKIIEDVKEKCNCVNC